MWQYAHVSGHDQLNTLRYDNPKLKQSHFTTIIHLMLVVNSSYYMSRLYLLQQHNVNSDTNCLIRIKSEKSQIWDRSVYCWNHCQWSKFNDIKNSSNFHSHFVSTTQWSVVSSIPGQSNFMKHRSTQPCIPTGWLNRVSTTAEVKARMSPLPGGR